MNHCAPLKQARMTFSPWILLKIQVCKTLEKIKQNLFLLATYKTRPFAILIRDLN